MPEVSNGIPTGGTLPGLYGQQNENTQNNQFKSYNEAAKENTNDLTTALDKQPNKDDQSFRDDEGQQKQTQDQIEAKKKAEEEILIKTCIAKAIEMHKADFERNNMQISSVKTLSMSGQDKTDTVRLDISSIGDNFQMYFDENANLILENHRDCPEKNMIGDKYFDELDDPDKQKAFADRADLAKERTVLSKDQIDKEIQEMGFENKADLEQSTGMDLSGSGAGGQLQQNNMNLKQQTANNIQAKAEAFIDPKARFSREENVGEAVHVEGAKTIAIVGSNAYKITEQGEVEKTDLIAKGGPVSAVQIQGNHVVDTRATALYNRANPNAAIGIGVGGSPVAITNPNGEGAIARSLNEQRNSNSGKVDDMFRRSELENSAEHAKDMYNRNGHELVSEMHTSNDPVGNELTNLANKYKMKEEEVEEFYHNALAKGKGPQDALSETRELCAEKDRANRHEPETHGERTLGPQGNPNA